VPPRVAILPPVPVPYREPLFRALAERGRIEPRVIYLSARQPGWDQPADWFPERKGYPSEVLPAWQRGRAGRSPLTVPRGLGPALDGSQPDCVVSWEFGPATWRAWVWCRRHRRPLVVFSELTPWSDAALTELQLRMHRLLAPRMDGFVVASSQGVERLARLGVERSRVEVALQSADLVALRSVSPDASAGGLASPEASAPRAPSPAASPPRAPSPAASPPRAPSPAASPDGRPVRVLVVGRLVPDKNLARLLEAFAGAGFADGEAELVIYGTGPLEAELRARAGRLGLPARFEGQLAPAALAAVYSRADVLALVSTYEPFGVTLREGAAAGLPLLASRRAGAAGDVAIEGENALLVDPGSHEEIGAALLRLVREPALRARLAAGSRAVTERHPPEADVEAWERATLRALKQAG
jgi:glycosyltransferase involved in cell wall biosynthesis